MDNDVIQLVKLAKVSSLTCEAAKKFMCEVTKACGEAGLNPAIGSISVACDVLESAIATSKMFGVEYDLVAWAKSVMERCSVDQ